MTTMTPFVPPSPGAWELEQTHFTKPPSVYLATLFPDAMMRGFREGTAHYGALLDHLEVAVINRFVYAAPRAVAAPKTAQGPPPKLLFKLLCVLHPELRRRIRRAEEVFRTRAWRDDVRKWDIEVKPAMATEARALLTEDLASASDTALADHVRRASEFATRAMFWHHRFNVCAMLPIGDFLVHTMAWTGMPAPELLQITRGLSPVSAGALDELATLRQAIAADPIAQTVLKLDRPPGELVDAIAGLQSPTGAAMRAWLDVVGLRVVGGYDVADRHAREHPELLLKVIRAEPGGEEVARDAAQQAIERVRAKVPSEHRAAFDELLAEAQLTYRIRDERVFHGDALAIGVARRSLLAAGRRLQARGRLHEAEHLVDATPGEVAALLAGRGAPSPDELAARAAWRQETPITVAPRTLGFPPSPPPPAEWLPGAAARMQRVIALVLGLMFDVHKAGGTAPSARAPHTPSVAPSATTLKGFGVSPGVYEGVARVIAGVDELPRIQQGEVLVTSSTGPTFNVVLPLIGALVTERGGALSHAAIVSREYGLPGVVGCIGATKSIATGARVRVDGSTGEVWVLS